MVKIEIDGKEIKAKDGAMLIEAADDAGIYVPRFCYHKKLSVAANCRMCLVEVDKARKPLPACATPVTDGMRIFTRSPAAIAAQRGVMEFLLINHPLDCPICDQGGECELQDVAMGYGRDISRYNEGKRVVQDKNIGPLIATDMTRCIHCTRCVRFGDEIAGLKELGATGRSEHMSIGTYVEASIDSELSGNMIDLCPVGALTSKPFRFQARAWEMQQRSGVAPHDAVGSNVYFHVKGREVMRVVPQDNEEINETWISDRDRFSYEALSHKDRVGSPMIKQNGEWKTVDWQTALEFAATGLRRIVDQDPNQVGVLAAGNSTTEEFYLLQKLARGVYVNNIDYRLRQADFSNDDIAPAVYGLGQPVANLEKVGAALLVGSNLRKDQPLLGHRIRKASMSGAKIAALNSMDYEFRFKLSEKIIAAPSKLAAEMGAIVKALMGLSNGPEMPGINTLLTSVEVTDVHQRIANDLLKAPNATIILGSQVMSHEDFATISMLANAAAQLSDSKLAYLPATSNSVGATLTGFVPTRGAGGKSVTAGLNAREMLEKKLKGYLLLGVEPERDCYDSVTAVAAMKNAEFVVSLTSFANETMKECAHVILPIGSFAETAGTFVNASGMWQSFEGVIAPHGEARPAWKVLRVLGNLFDVEGFDYINIDEVHDDVCKAVGTANMDTGMSWRCPAKLTANVSGLERIADLPMYSVDSLVRRAKALQETQDALVAAVYMNISTASSLNLDVEKKVTATQGDRSAQMPIVINNRVPANCVFIPAAVAGLESFGISSGAVELRQA